MSDFKDRMIEAYERGECSYEGAYDHVRESLADRADMQRKQFREDENAHERMTGQHAPFVCGPEDVDESAGFSIRVDES